MILLSKCGIYISVLKIKFRTYLHLTLISKIIARCCQTQIGRLKTREKLELGVTTMMMTTKVVISLAGCSKRSPTEEIPRTETQRRSPPRSGKNDNCATEDIKVQEDTIEGKCVAGPVLTRAQAKKSDKNYLLKVKEAMSSVDKTTIEDLQGRVWCLNQIHVSNSRLGKTQPSHGLGYRKCNQIQDGAEDFIYCYNDFSY